MNSCRQGYNVRKIEFSIPEQFFLDVFRSGGDRDVMQSPQTMLTIYQVLMRQFGKLQGGSHEVRG